MIKPTVGRVVWYTPFGSQDQGLRDDASQPLAGIVSYVWNDRLINLMIIGADGTPHNRTSVRLVQEGDVAPYGASFAEWMPYQKGQAAKAEALEKELRK